MEHVAYSLQTSRHGLVGSFIRFVVQVMPIQAEELRHPDLWHKGWIAGDEIPHLLL